MVPEGRLLVVQGSGQLCLNDGPQLAGQVILHPVNSQSSHKLDTL